MARSGTKAAPAPVLIDTGILVALFDRADPLHQRVTQWLGAFHGPLHTVDAVLVETAFFLPARLRVALAELSATSALTVHHPDAGGRQRMAQLLAKYADQDPDWADAALIWLAETLGCERIATIDVRDFGVYRIQGRKRFRLEMI
jgi:predicted nucleic acid-binding protein